ncbi:MAG: nucleotidyltransferase domain-containing protein [Candidatus Diapherotrites archaeon]
MFSNWKRFKGWLVLEFFLENGTRIHVNGLAKKLKISPGTAQTYLTEYERQGMLEREKTANTMGYRLRESPLSLELRKALFISKIGNFAAEFLKENPHTAKLALYGSHAKGTYDMKSDIDLIAISQDKKPGLKALQRLEEKTGKEAAIQVFTLAEWKRLLEKNDHFAFAVIGNSIMLAGEPL